MSKPAGRIEVEARKRLAKLRRTLPTTKPVRLRWIADNQRLHGAAYETQRVFWIELARSSCGDCVMETLAHEYAHRLAWNAGDNRRDQTAHDDYWGIAYARVVRVLAGEPPPGP